MNTYTIEAMKIIRLKATLEAPTREEAFEIVDTEYILDDFEETGSEFVFTHIS